MSSAVDKFFKKLDMSPLPSSSQPVSIIPINSPYQSKTTPSFQVTNSQLRPSVKYPTFAGGHGTSKRTVRIKKRTSGSFFKPVFCTLNLLNL